MKCSLLCFSQAVFCVCLFGLFGCGTIQKRPESWPTVSECQFKDIDISDFGTFSNIGIDAAGGSTKLSDLLFVLQPEPGHATDQFNNNRLQKTLSKAQRIRFKTVNKNYIILEFIDGDVDTEWKVDGLINTIQVGEGCIRVSTKRTINREMVTANENRVIEISRISKQVIVHSEAKHYGLMFIVPAWGRDNLWATFNQTD